jgi:hypothetical protein
MRLLSRRGFLKGSGAALALSLVNLDLRAPEAAMSPSGVLDGFPEYTDFRDVYRRNWTWDRALGEIADATIDALVEDGSGSVIWDMGSAITNGCHGLGLTRTVGVLDTPMLEANAEIADHYPGATVTTGKICFLGSADDLHYSDVILIWGGNPVYTQIPNAHFILEARYHGARVVAIAPDYNASAIHADEWVPVNVGTDAALGLMSASAMLKMKWQGYTTEMMIGELGREEYRNGRFPAAAMFLYLHGGLRGLYGSAKEWDPELPREFGDYFQEALEKGWQVVPETPPRIPFEAGGNLLRRVRGYDRMIDGLLPRHHQGGRADRRLERRLGLPLSVPEDATEAGYRVRYHHVQGPRWPHTPARSRL